MCLFCDGYSEEQVRSALDLTIRTHGFAIQSVAGPRPWYYTVGLHESYDHPELVITDIKVESAAETINTMTAPLVDGGAELDIEWMVANGVSTRPVHVAHSATSMFAMWAMHYGHQPPAGRFRQIVPPRSWFCSCHGDRTPRLDLPTPWIGLAPPNRAERRRRPKGR